MKIALIDVDGHNFPNIPLMKLSAWHKAHGDFVEWYEPLFSKDIDICYMSKVFTFTPDYDAPVNAKKSSKAARATHTPTAVRRLRMRLSISIPITQSTTKKSPK